MTRTFPSPLRLFNRRALQGHQSLHALSADVLERVDGGEQLDAMDLAREEFLEKLPQSRLRCHCARDAVNKNRMEFAGARRPELVAYSDHLLILDFEPIKNPQRREQH